MNKPILYNVLLQFNYPQIQNPYILIASYTSDPNLSIGESIAIRDVKVGFEHESETLPVVDVGNKVFNFNARVVRIEKAILWKNCFNVNIIVKGVEHQHIIKEYILAWEKLS